MSVYRSLYLNRLLCCSVINMGNIPIIREKPRLMCTLYLAGLLTNANAFECAFEYSAFEYAFKSVLEIVNALAFECYPETFDLSNAQSNPCVIL